MSTDKPKLVSDETDDTYGELQKDFEGVLQNLASDTNLEKIKEEYRKLHNAFQRTHRSEQKLVDKCRELNNDIVANASKVQAALRLSRQDQQSIQILKREIDKAWKMVDSAKGREKQSRETIHKLREEVQNLSKLVDQGAGLTLGQEKAVNELTKVKDSLSQEVQTLQVKLTEKDRLHNDLIEQGLQYKQKKKEMDQEIKKLIETTTKQKSENKNKGIMIEDLKKELKTRATTRSKLMKTIDEKSADIRELEAEKKDFEERYIILDEQKQGADQEIRRNHSKIQELLLTIDKNRDREAQLLGKLSGTQAEIAQKKKDLKRYAFELQRAKIRYDKLNDLKDKTLRNQKSAEETRDNMIGEIKKIREEVVAQKKNADIDEKLVKELQNQVRRLQQQVIQSREKNQEQQRIFEAHEQKKKVLTETLQKQKKEELRLRQNAFELEKANDKALGKSASWHAKYLEMVDMVKLREADIHDLKKFIAEGEKKLKLQKSLYEQVRADRNFFSKKHVQSRDEIAEMKQKFKIMKHQIEQLKEEIQMKEIQLINAHFTRKQLTDEKKGKDRRLNQKNEVLETADKVLANQNDEIQNLRQTLEGAEFEQQRQRKIYEDVVQERDILAAQLIRRNDELALLYEKIRIQQSTLSKGEVQYRQRLKDIQMMKLQLTNVKREISIRNQEVENTEALKNELYNLQRELLQEKTKVKALSEELENPMNVHRWRQLEGSDPKRWELIQKIQTLQKRLIVKTEEAVEKDMLLQEKEKLYMELKNILARQPGPEVSEQLSIYQQNLKEKTRQMKAMAAELNMHQAQISEYRYEIERLSRELQDNKRKFFEQKRKDQIQKEVQRENQREELLLAQQQRFHLTHPKIAGGGFNLQATT